MTRRHTDRVPARLKSGSGVPTGPSLSEGSTSDRISKSGAVLQHARPHIVQIVLYSQSHVDDKVLFRMPEKLKEYTAQEEWG